MWRDGENSALKVPFFGWEVDLSPPKSARSFGSMPETDYRQFSSWLARAMREEVTEVSLHFLTTDKERIKTAVRRVGAMQSPLAGLDDKTERRYLSGVGAAWRSTYRSFGPLMIEDPSQRRKLRWDHDAAEIKNAWAVFVRRVASAPTLASMASVPLRQQPKSLHPELPAGFGPSSPLATVRAFQDTAAALFAAGSPKTVPPFVRDVLLQLGVIAQFGAGQALLIELENELHQAHKTYNKVAEIWGDAIYVKRPVAGDSFASHGVLACCHRGYTQRMIWHRVDIKDHNDSSLLFVSRAEVDAQIASLIPQMATKQVSGEVEVDTGYLLHLKAVESLMKTPTGSWATPVKSTSVHRAPRWIVLAHELCHVTNYGRYNLLGHASGAGQVPASLFSSQSAAMLSLALGVKGKGHAFWAHSFFSEVARVDDSVWQDAGRVIASLPPGGDREVRWVRASWRLMTELRRAMRGEGWSLSYGDFLFDGDDFPSLLTEGAHVNGGVGDALVGVLMRNAGAFGADTIGNAERVLFGVFSSLRAWGRAAAAVGDMVAEMVVCSANSGDLQQAALAATPFHQAMFYPASDQFIFSHVGIPTKWASAKPTSGRTGGGQDSAWLADTEAPELNSLLSMAKPFKPADF